MEILVNAAVPGNFYLESTPHFTIPLAIWNEEIFPQTISMNYKIKVNSQYQWYLMRSHSKIVNYFIEKFRNRCNTTFDKFLEYNPKMFTQILINLPSCKLPPRPVPFQ